MVEYSSRARKGYAYLYRSYNDIDVYVEDKANRAAYEILIRRLLGDRGRVTRVHQLGGRSVVEEECRKLRGDRTRRRIFVVDSDLGLIYGSRQTRIKDLHIIRAYCFENLIISPAAAYEVARQSDTESASSILLAKIDIEKAIRDAERLFLPLFVAYSIAHFGRCGCSTVAYSVYKLLDVGRDGEISKQRVRERFVEIIGFIWKKIGRERYAAVKRDIYRRINLDDIPRERYISGKDYLLPILHLRLKGRARFQGNKDQLLAQLTRHSELEVWRSFREKLLRRIR